MNEITKKQIKQIKNGNHAVLMDCLDFLLDSYKEDKYDLGYGAALADMSVHAQRLAGYLHQKALETDKSCPKDGVPALTIEESAKVIEDYFTKGLKLK